MWPIIDEKVWNNTSTVALCYKNVFKKIFIDYLTFVMCCMMYVGDTCDGCLICMCDQILMAFYTYLQCISTLRNISKIFKYRVLDGWEGDEGKITQNS